MDIRAWATDYINANFGDNAKYIIDTLDMQSEIRMAEYYDRAGDTKMFGFMQDSIKEHAAYINENRLSPAVAKVGDGVTIHLWSDCHAGTIIKRTATTITVQQDKATLKPDFKPEFVGMHCVNQSEQDYDYEPDPNGEITVYRWSKKNNRYQGGGDGSIICTKGRHEFYDYNF